MRSYRGINPKSPVPPAYAPPQPANSNRKRNAITVLENLDIFLQLCCCSLDCVCLVFGQL